jgi:hypothetical protein
VDHRPARQCEAETFLGRNQQTRRVVDARCARLPGDALVGFLPDAPRYVVALEQRNFAQTRTPLEHPMLPDQLRRADRHDPIVEQFLAVQVGIVAAPESDRHMNCGAGEIDEFARGVEAQLDVGTLAPERANSRQQPHLKKRSQQGDLQRSGAPILLDLVHRRLELVEAGADGRQQFETLFGNLDLAAAAAKQRYL